MNLTLGLVISALHWATLFSLLACRRPALSSRLVMVFALTLLLLCIPIAGITPIYYLRGVFGEFSLTTTLVLVCLAAHRVTQGGLKLPEPELRWLAGLIAAVALWFYPMSLGLGMIDPYQWGYQPAALAAVALGVAAIAWYAGRYLVVAVVSTALVGYKLNLLESNNLWDYLLDPFAAGAALSYLRSALRQRGASTGKPEHEEHQQVADDGRVVQIKGHVLSREKPPVFGQNHPAGKQHGHTYSEPGVLRATAAAEKAK